MLSSHKGSKAVRTYNEVPIVLADFFDEMTIICRFGNLVIFKKCQQITKQEGNGSYRFARRHLAGEQPSLALKVLEKWLKERKPLIRDTS